MSDRPDDPTPPPPPPTDPSALETDDRFVSGPWHGFYIQWGVRGKQSLSLSFRGGVVTGHGADPAGDFAVKGAYDVERGRAWLRKIYPSHVVEYDGHAEGDGIWGGWQIRSASGRDHGGFHIWPHAEGQGASEELEQEQPCEVPAQPARV